MTVITTTSNFWYFRAAMFAATIKSMALTLGS